jgi:hypothetical protein
MKLVNDTYQLVKAVFLRVFIATGIILALMSIYVQKKHREAEAFLDQIDLQARNTSGATFYASKKRVFVGQDLARNDIVRHLRSTNFVQSDEPNRPGSYRLQRNDTVAITPRLAEFQPVSLTSNATRLPP